MADYKEKLTKIIEKQVKGDFTLEVPPDHNLGDFALPCFPFAKEMKKNPAEIAKELSEKIKADFIERIEVKGPYLNFFIKKDNLAKQIIEKVEKEKECYGSKKQSKQKVMVEFSQANTHKAFHVGHIRGTSLGESLARILSFIGKDVTRANYQGDIGMHVAKWLWCYTNFHSKEGIKADEEWFASIYVDAIKKLSENDELSKEVEEVNRKLDAKSDKKLNELWKKTRKLCLDALENIYKELNTKFDNYFFESEIEKDAKDIAKELLDKKVAEISDEATVVNLEKDNLGVFLILRRDGTVLYGGKDLALAAKKFRKYKIDESIYVVGKEQEHYFMQVFKVLELMGFKSKDKCKYVPVSLVKLPHGKMSSRTGDNILYSSFKQELVDYAKSEIKKRWEDLSLKEVEKRALVISIAAMKYSMLKQNPNKEIVFVKEDAMKFEGDTGPYLLYSYARASSIVRKSEKKGKKFEIEELHEKEVLLVKKIAEFPEIVLKSSDQLNPGIIANYAFQLSQQFNEFYAACKVIGEKEEVFRIKLVECFRQTLKNSLELLGIGVLEEM